MTPPEVIQAYKDKYAAFPDLVERIVRQLKYERGKKEISIICFQVWDKTKEGGDFWHKFHLLESDRQLTRQSIDAAYAEFGIEPLAPEIDMSWLTNTPYHDLWEYMANYHNLTLLQSEVMDIVSVIEDCQRKIK
ncbi:hypothetical protein MUK70_11685 [Dyadobacter chenwenxiniae]|uniref:Uncharacterized protein n=1 Tax=Dyadobacter chenwenxiniae TaxID=2906456 RepID=A0A9X1PEL5_9BACT|nr:hypothetical protein [Dyadobacter chenwenxiniae]MCF0059902.1 hypothetical protein [Dyadobacter chenwenxiniae]UON85641.1 hypothetical protein MUK70_11685 [Dyadobacter chenwenxiniae]